MNAIEIPVEFQSGGCQLFGIIHRPAIPNRRGVVILTGGNRCGPHRWFVLQAREWAMAGYPVLNISTRGTGDSEGTYDGIDSVEADLSSAIDEFFRREPGLEEVVLWGVCFHASEALLYSPKDSRVAAVVLVNLYLETDLYLLDPLSGQSLPMQRTVAMTYLRYVFARVSTLDFWKQMPVLRNSIDWNVAPRRLGRQLLIALGIKNGKSVAKPHASCLSDQLLEAFREFRGRVLLILSGSDLDANIVRNLLNTQTWSEARCLNRTTIHELREADHMFSRRAWSDQASTWTLEWLKSWQ